MSWFSRWRTPLESARWVVIDCETSGLDPRRERLLSVAAVRVRGERIELAQAFSSRVHAPVPSAAGNILVHGIGADAQLAAPPAAEVLPQFARFVEGDIAVAFQTWFDREVLRRAMSALELAAPRRWLDLQPLAAVLFPEKRLASLDEWLAAFGIEHGGRHDALLDALAAAELLLVLLAQARRRGVHDVQALLALSCATALP